MGACPLGRAWGTLNFIILKCLEWTTYLRQVAFWRQGNVLSIPRKSEHITQAVLFCCWKRPENHGKSRILGNSCVFSLSGGQTKYVENMIFLSAPFSDSSIRKVAGASDADGERSFRRPNASKSPVPSTLQRCCFGAQQLAQA